MSRQITFAGTQCPGLVRILDPEAGFGVGRLRVTPAQGITLTDPDIPAEFEIDWRGCLVLARLETTSLRVSVILGQVPSMATSGITLRAAVFEMLDRLPAELPLPWSLGLLPDHRVRVEWSQPLPPPISVANLVCRLTEFLLALAPYLDLLEESGIILWSASTPAVAGTASS